MNQKNLLSISILVLNYNGIEYLKETIPALLSLDYTNLEFIVVDNGSTDGSIEFLKKHEALEVVENGKNLGYSKGKNVGFKKATGDYILSLDEDILIKDRQLLQKLLHNYDSQTGFLQVPLIDRGQEKTFYYGTYYSIYGLNMHRASISLKKILRKKNKVEICGPTGGFFFISREHLGKIGFIDEIQPFHLDDVDVGPRSWIFGFKNYLITDTYCEHLGINKTANPEIFIKRFRLIFSGHARAMVKNFNLFNLVFRFPIFFVFQLAKATKFSVTKRTPKIMVAFLLSIIFFLKNLSDTLRQRKIIQTKRIIRKDIFLKIKAGSFD